MPELPEVETVRRQLAPVLEGRRLGRVVVTGARTVRRRPDGFAEAVSGRLVERVDRHGKFLLVRLDGGEVLVGHLRMSGQLLLAAPGDPLRPHTHAVLPVEGEGREVRFVDPRTFGELFLAPPPAEPGGVPVELAHLGPDALEPGVGAAWLHEQLGRRRTSLKAALLDQRAVAGLGNIYADEVLHHARLAPHRLGVDLARPAARRLADAIRAVLPVAVEAGGSSLADEQYVDLHGRAGSYQHLHQVHGRAGRPCPRCGREVRRAVLAGRSTYWCSWCQR